MKFRIKVSVLSALCIISIPVVGEFKKIGKKVDPRSTRLMLSKTIPQKIGEIVVVRDMGPPLTFITERLLREGPYDEKYYSSTYIVSDSQNPNRDSKKVLSYDLYEAKPLPTVPRDRSSKMMKFIDAVENNNEKEMTFLALNMDNPRIMNRLRVSVEDAVYEIFKEAVKNKQNRLIVKAGEFLIDRPGSIIDDNWKFIDKELERAQYKVEDLA